MILLRCLVVVGVLCGSTMAQSRYELDFEPSYEVLQSKYELRSATVSTTTAERKHQLAPKPTHTLDVCEQSYPHIPVNWTSTNKVLALTFDDGPHAKSMSAVLDVLKQHQVKATFFVNTYRSSDWLGSFMSPENQAVVRRAVAEGHEMGSHAAQHLHLTRLTAQEIDNQIAWAISNITAATRLPQVQLFRAPYGDGYWSSGKAPNQITKHLWDLVKKHHVHVAWTFSGNDYKLGGNRTGCDEALFQAYGPPVVQQNITGVVLMHSTPNAMGGCPEALHKLINYWKDAGYSFISIHHILMELYGISAAAAIQRVQRCTNH